VERPYLALLGNVTPADLRAIARRGAPLWGDGFWARFALVAPSTRERSRHRFPDGERHVPDKLSAALSAWHTRLGVPTPAISDASDERGRPTKRANCEAPTLTPCTMEAGVADAFYRYNDALLDIAAQSQHEDLDGNYARLAEKALRVAMLLASISNGGAITLKHWARAQLIAEEWRAGLHAAFAQVNEVEPSVAAQMEEKLTEVVTRLAARADKAGGPLPTAADATRYIRGLSSGDAQRYLEGLAKAGALQAMPEDRTTRYRPVTATETG
jgi:hypothetical protein